MVNDKQKFLLISACAIFVLLADRLAKYLVQENLVLNQPIKIVGGLSLTYIKNTGAAFGLLKGANLFLIAATLAAIALIMHYYKDLPKNKIAYVSIGLLLGAIIGNLVDRVFMGAVIDFIDLGFWPAFNIADMSASIGVGLLVTSILLEKK